MNTETRSRISNQRQRWRCPFCGQRSVCSAIGSPEQISTKLGITGYKVRRKCKICFMSFYTFEIHHAEFERHQQCFEKQDWLIKEYENSVKPLAALPQISDTAAKLLTLANKES